MKYFLAFLLILIPIQSFAQNQTMVTKETANTYFANCVKQPPSEQFSKDAQNMLCACTAARMTQFFSMEEMQAMMSQDPAVARPAYNKMLTHIYAPCMETPAREHYFNTCMADTNVSTRSDAKKICNCLGDNIGLYFRLHGPDLFRNILKKNPNVTDPMAAAYSDPGFLAMAQTKLQSCLY